LFDKRDSLILQFVIDTLKKYVPEQAAAAAFALIKEHGVHLKIVSERVTRHGDYRSIKSLSIRV